MSAQMHKLRGHFRHHSRLWFARHRGLAQWALEGDCGESTNAQRFFSKDSARSTTDWGEVRQQPAAARGRPDDD